MTGVLDTISIIGNPESKSRIISAFTENDLEQSCYWILTMRKRRNKAVVNLWIPADLQFNKPESLTNDKCTDYFNYLIHLLSVYADDWKHLSRRVLRRYIPNDRISPILECLEREQVIEINHSYAVTGYSKSYRLHPRLNKSRLIPYACSNEKIIKGYTEQNKPIDSNLLHWLYKVQIDHAAADNTIDKIKETDRQAQLLRLSIDRIKRKSIHADRCNYGRLHTPYTCLKSELRPFLSIDSKTLINVDVSNSQPNLLAIIFQDADYYLNHYDSMKLDNIKDRLTDTSLHNSRKGSTRSILSDYDLHNSVMVSPSVHHTNNVSDFVPACQSGQLYDLLSFHSEINDRRLTKELCFAHVFFGKVFERKTGNAKALVDTFARLFPAEWSFIQQFKVKHGYESLSRLMQRIESAIMIDDVATALASTIPVITIHDSIMTTPEHIQTVADAIVDGFRRYGVIVTVKTDLAKPESAVAAA